MTGIKKIQEGEMEIVIIDTFVLENECIIN
jgi:hypothetical protein